MGWCRSARTWAALKPPEDATGVQGIVYLQLLDMVTVVCPEGFVIDWVCPAPEWVRVWVNVTEPDQVVLSACVGPVAVGSMWVP